MVSVSCLIFLCLFPKLFAECTTYGGTLSLGSGPVSADGFFPCTLATDATISAGLTLGNSDQNTRIEPSGSNAITLTGSANIVLVTSTNKITLALKKLILLYSQKTNAAANSFPLIRVENGGLVLDQVIFGDSSVTSVITAPIRVKNAILLTIINSQFLNFSNSEADTAYGGVINADFDKVSHMDPVTKLGGVEISVISSKFLKNTLVNKGYGAAFLFSTYTAGAEITIENDEFTDCSSQKYYAGAFDLYSGFNPPEVTIKNCNFTRCTAGRDSGAIWIQMARPGIIELCNFTDCEAKNDGGGIYIYDDFEVFWKGSEYAIKDCKFVGCISVGETNRPAQGAAIMMETAGWTQIESCSFEDCVSNAYHGHGGAVSNPNTDLMSLKILLCNFTRCKVDAVDGTNPGSDDSGGDGGAVSVKMSLFNTVIIEQCKFLDCSASNHGGSLDVEGGSLIVKASTFINSKAINGNGGSIRTTGLIITIESTTFTNSQLGNAAAKGVEIYSERDLIHYGGGNTFACAGDNDVIYKDVSLKLVVCDHKTIEDLECSGTQHMTLSRLRTLFFSALVVLVFGLLL